MYSVLVVDAHGLIFILGKEHIRRHQEATSSKALWNKNEVVLKWWNLWRFQLYRVTWGKGTTASHGPISGFPLSMAGIGPCALPLVDNFTAGWSVWLYVLLRVCVVKLLANNFFSPDKIFLLLNKAVFDYCIWSFWNNCELCLKVLFIGIILSSSLGY
jgi:hypothetical protein